MESVFKPIENLKNDTATVGKKLLCTSISLSLLFLGMGTISFAEPEFNMENLDPPALTNHSHGNEESPDVVNPPVETSSSLSDDEEDRAEQEETLAGLFYRVVKSFYVEKFAIEEYDLNVTRWYYKVERLKSDASFDQEVVLECFIAIKKDLRWVSMVLDMFHDLEETLSNILNIGCTEEEQRHILHKIEFVVSCVPKTMNIYTYRGYIKRDKVEGNQRKLAGKVDSIIQKYTDFKKRYKNMQIWKY